MSDPGRVVLTATGKRAILSSGKVGVFNEAGTCVECCGGVSEFWWQFSDLGYYNGCLTTRSYGEADMPPDSPFTVSGTIETGFALRMDFEDSLGCGGFNPCQQHAHATLFLKVFKPGVITCDYHGVLSTDNSPNAGFMSLSMNGVLKSYAESSGDVQDPNDPCEMGPPVTDPAPPVSEALQPGPAPNVVSAEFNTMTTSTLGAFFEFVIQIVFD